MCPGVSVLINNYNYGRFVARAIDSVLAQSEQGAEIVVVDDGSNDQSRSVLRKYQGQVKVIFQGNCGQAAAINAGVEASEGEFLCFLDADDWWAPGKLAATIAAFRSNPKAALVYHRLQPVLADQSPILKPLPRTLCGGDLSLRLTKSAGWWPFPMTSAIAVRRNAWEAVGDIPEEFRISADAWLVGVYPFMGDVVALPGPLGFYRIHSNNWYRPIDDAAMLRKRMAHWEATVEATNRFLAERGQPGRLRLSDHYPYRIAAAKLQGADSRTRLGLFLQGLRFQGEPNLLRRTRDAMRDIRDIPSATPSVSLSEAAE